jgi:hypothetical protein
MVGLEDTVWSTIEDDGAEVWAEPAASFLQGFLPEETDIVWSPELFWWKLGDVNPAGRGYLSLAISDNQVIATTSITPKRLWVDGRVIVGGEIGDTYTSEAFRRKGRPIDLYMDNKDPEAYVNKSVFGRLVMQTRRRAEKAGFKLIYGTPNQNSMPGYVSRLNFFHYNTIQCHCYVRLRAAGLLNRKPRLRPITNIVSGIDQLFSNTLGMGAKLAARGCTVDAHQPTESEINGLWEKLKSSVHFSVLRDAAWFKYRYQDHPIATYEFVALYRGGRLNGLMVFRRFRDMAGDSVVNVADWLLASDDKAGFALLLTQGIAELSPGAETINIWINKQDGLSSVLPKLCFVRRGEAPIIFASNLDALARYESGEAFEMSLGTSDNV